MPRTEVSQPDVTASAAAAGERSLDEIVRELERIGLPRSRDALRTALMNWRRKQGWVTNPKPGRYGLSELGKRVVGVE